MEPLESIETRQATPPDDQRAAIECLESGAGRDAKVKRIDTHGAMFFLIGQEALKIKRTEEYDYMDLSTIEKRRALLDRDYLLNSDAAPSICRGVLQLFRRADGDVALGGYTSAITERSFGAIGNQAEHILREGQDAILDAVYNNPDTRAAAEALATAAGCGFVGIWRDSPNRRRQARAASREQDASGADAAVVEAQDSLDAGGGHHLARDRCRPIRGKGSRMDFGNSDEVRFRQPKKLWRQECGVTP